jgi:hypothetical protein
MITTTFKIDKDMLSQVKKRAQLSGFSMGAIIRCLLKMWLDREIEIRA